MGAGKTGNGEMVQEDLKVMIELDHVSEFKYLGDLGR